MVSLARSINTNSAGAVFLDDAVNMEDREHMRPILESYGVFRPLPTIPPFTIHLLYTVALEILCIVYAVLHPDEKHKCREYFIIIYVHIGLWFLTMIIDLIAKVKHENLRINGYLEFYKKTLAYHKFPIYVVSLWSVFLLFISALMQHFYPDNFAEKCLKSGVFSPISYLCAAISLEFCVLMHINITYIVKVKKFNSQRPLPDVQREEWEACSATDTFAQGEIGYRQLGDKVYDLLEKQADLIRHLKDHNARLGEKLMVLSAQREARSHPE